MLEFSSTVLPALSPIACVVSGFYCVALHACLVWAVESLLPSHLYCVEILVRQSLVDDSDCPATGFLTS